MIVEVKPKTRYINLTAHEARAFQRAATILVRECKGAPCDAKGYQMSLGSACFFNRPNRNGKHNGGMQVCDPIKSPYQPGDLLIGREAWGYRGQTVTIGHPLRVFDLVYKVDGSRKSFRLHPSDAYGLPVQRLRNCYESTEAYDQYLNDYWDMWLSAARMPQWAARVRRIVTNVSLKRCQDLTEGECEAAGYSGAKHYLGHGDFEEVSPSEQFAEANAKLWAENKFVWVTSVKEEA